MRASILAMLGLGCMLTVSSALAQRLVADVPFDFIVKDTVLPAGEYGVDWDSNAQGAVFIRCPKQKAGVVTLAWNSSIPNPGKGGALVFTRYGNTHYLSQIRTADMERKVPQSKSEREAIAALGKAEQTTVAARTR